MGKVRALTNRSRHRTLADLLRQLNGVLRGWCNYFRHGVSKATFSYLTMFAWRRVTGWLRKRHPKANWKTLRRRFLTGHPVRRPVEDGITLFYPNETEVTRYRWRGSNIPTSWTLHVKRLTATQTA